MWKDFLYYTKTERQGIIVLVVLILGVYAAPKLFSFFKHAEDTDCKENEKFDKEYNDFISVLRETKPHQKSGPSFQSSPQREIKLAIFDPNTADSTTLLSLGLPSRMVKNILHYRNKQGKFRYPEDFRKIYGLTEEQYRTLYPYIQITKDFSSKGYGTIINRTKCTTGHTHEISPRNHHQPQLRRYHRTEEDSGNRKQHCPDDGELPRTAGRLFPNRAVTGDSSKGRETPSVVFH